MGFGVICHMENTLSQPMSKIQVRLQGLHEDNNKGGVYCTKYESGKVILLQ